MSGLQVTDDRRARGDYLWTLPPIRGEFIFRRDSALDDQDIFQDR